MRRILTIASTLLIVVAGWIYLFTGTPAWGPTFAPQNTNIVSIELSWGNTTRTNKDSNDIAQVLATMRKARQHAVAATPAYGLLTFYYMDGSTNRFFLEPADRFGALQFADKSNGYAISVNEMLDTFERVGLLEQNGK